MQHARTVVVLAAILTALMVACGRTEIVVITATPSPSPTPTQTYSQWLGQQVAVTICSDPEATVPDYRNENRNPPYSADFYCRRPDRATPTLTPDPVATWVAATIAAIGPRGSHVEPAPTPTPNATATRVVRNSVTATRAAATRTARPTATPKPTATPRPWSTPTPRPTATPEPTLRPIATPRRPTATPQIPSHPPALPPQIPNNRAPEPERDWDKEANSYIRGSGWCYRGDESRRRLLGMPWMQDGVTQAEYKTLSTIFRFNCVNWPDGELNEDGWEALLELAEGSSARSQALLRAIGMEAIHDRDSAEEIISQADVDSRIVSTHHSPELIISIVREEETVSDQTIDWIHYAVAFNEWLMGEPIPLSHLVVYIKNISDSGGQNYGIGYTCAPERGPEDGDWGFQWFRDCLIHETAHFWWSVSMPWLDEGMAMMVEYLANEHAGELHGGSIVSRNGCTIPDLRTLTEINSTTDDSDDFHCNYHLGQALFLELYEGLGTVDDMAQFALNARYLHDEVTAAWAAHFADDWTEYDEDWRPGYIALLKSAFPGQDAVIDRHWNGG